MAKTSEPLYNLTVDEILEIPEEELKAKRNGECKEIHRLEDTIRDFEDYLKVNK